jgi:hypothetical protein
MKKILIATAIASTFVLSACDVKETSTQIERKKQEELSLRGVESVGMPAIVNFAEKRMMKDIIELRDQNVATYVYITDMNGRLHKICNAVGYGLPYATQYTNPMRISGDGHGYVTLPQADPNGLYSPASADGTWVLCVDTKSGKPKPVYIEPRVIVSPMPLGE